MLWSGNFRLHLKSFKGGLRSCTGVTVWNITGNKLSLETIRIILYNMIVVEKLM